MVEKLGYQKFCEKCVPKFLTEDHKKQCITASQAVTEAYLYHKDGDPLSCVLTAD